MSGPVAGRVGSGAPSPRPSRSSRNFRSSRSRFRSCCNNAALEHFEKRKDTFLPFHISVDRGRVTYLKENLGRKSAIALSMSLLCASPMCGRRWALTLGDGGTRAGVLMCWCAAVHGRIEFGSWSFWQSPCSSWCNWCNLVPRLPPLSLVGSRRASVALP
jgi:hypothetical protein